jgi:hypothetical protein
MTVKQREKAMKEFICKHEARVHGVLSCFDHMLFRGYLPIMSGWSMAQFLQGIEVKRSGLKPFLLENAERVKEHALAMASKQGRPFQYLATSFRKEDAARKLAERDGIEEGLVCIFSVLEPCRTCSFRFQHGQPYVQFARRKCLHLYFYFMDRDFGLIHVRIQTWFPMPIQVYMNAHEWLARKLEANGVRYTKQDNAFLWIEAHCALAPKILSKYARMITPQSKKGHNSAICFAISKSPSRRTPVICKLLPSSTIQPKRNATWTG